MLSDPEDVDGLALDMGAGRWVRTPPGDERSDEIAFRDERIHDCSHVRGGQVEVVERYGHACWSQVAPAPSVARRGA